MKYGNWVPISKAFTKHLPKDRPYTELEAAYSMQVDYDNHRSVTVSGYADLWQWSRNKVRNFLNRSGVSIAYPENTQEKRRQKGHITVQKRTLKGQEKDINWTKKGQIRFIDSKGLQNQKDINGTRKGHKKDIRRSTTNDPSILNPKKDKKYSPNSIEFELSSRLLNSIVKRNPKHKKPDLQKWALHIDRAMRLDGRTEQELRAVIQWCQADSFWQNNILSTEKLRQQFDKLWMQREAGSGKIRRDSKQNDVGHREQESGDGKYSKLHRVISSE